MPKIPESFSNVYSFLTRRMLPTWSKLLQTQFSSTSTMQNKLLQACFNEIFSTQHISWKFCYLVPTLIRSCLSHRLPLGIGARHLCFTGSNLPANVIYLVFNISAISLFSTSSSTSLGAQNRCSEVNLGKQWTKIIHKVVKKHIKIPVSSHGKLTCKRRGSFTSEWEKNTNLPLFLMTPIFLRCF